MRSPWLIPSTIEFFTKTAIDNNIPGGSLINEIARLADNYSVTGLLFILVLVQFPKAAWQLGITLTFCHAAIDMIRDYYPDTNFSSPLTMHFFWVLLMTALVAFLVSWFSRKEKSAVNLFLVLIWSCVAVSFLRMGIDPKTLNIDGLSLSQIIFGRFIVDIFFVVSAVVVSWILLRKFNIYKESFL